MQRSRKALLQKRAAASEKAVMGRRYLYKVSLSAVLLLWGIIFLLSSLTSYGNGYRDGLVAAVRESSWHETHKDENKEPDPLGTFSQSESTPAKDIQETTTSMNGDAEPSTEVLPNQDIIMTSSTVEKEKVAEESSDRGLSGLGAVAGESSQHDIQPEPSQGSDSVGTSTQSEATSDRDDLKLAVSMAEDAVTGGDVSASKDIKPNLLTVEKEQYPVTEEISDRAIKEEKEIPVKSDRLSRVAPPGLDEFKSKLSVAKENHISSQTGAVIHRVEPGGKEYNYASARYGAKVLAYNKEAKGASNILDKDEDKYLRNPCSAEEKYIIIELSEETLVDIIEIANFEHYSSNLKDFELLSSLTYPTDNWVKVGRFTALNVKHAQKFTLPEPKWARYLKVNLLSHYGSEFYCTLSLVEVYGVDAVERMLEDLIAVENKRIEPEEQNAAHVPAEEPTGGDELYRELFNEIDNEWGHGSTKIKPEAQKNSAPDPAVDSKPQQIGRMPGDTVLKILMQKVQNLDKNSAVLEGYLEELSSRYNNIFKEFDDDLAAKDLFLEKVRFAIKNLENSKEILASDIGELLSWKASVSSQMDQLVEDNKILRLKVDQIRDRQDEMENKGFAVIFMCFIFGCLAAFKLFVGVLLSVCRIQSVEEFCRCSSAWLVLLLSSCIVALILVS